MSLKFSVSGINKRAYEGSPNSQNIICHLRKELKVAKKTLC